MTNRSMMIRRGFPAAVAAAAFAALLLAPAARAADPFYLELLRDGTHAYDRGDFAVAARTLRLACFGMLDDPKALAACLARLALAQDKASDVDAFRDTFVRLTEVEERFQGYSQADLPAEVRGALEQKLAARIPASTLNSSPQAFRSRKPAAAAPAQVTGKATKPQPKDTPQPIAAPPASSAKGGPAQVQSPAAAPAVSSSVPSGPRPLSDEEKGKIETVRKLLAEPGSKSKELQQAFQIAQEVAAAHPESADAQRLAGESAYRISRWSDAAAYLQKGGGLPDSEPELLFYLAVSLFESGNREGAAAALRRALPNLQRTPFIDAYARKILGQ
jgi:tetratricopeptide (TPR) repeat protein